MTDLASNRGIARWSGDQRGTLHITGPAGNVVDSHPVTPPGDRPGPDILWHTGWTAYPGTEWQEEPPGQWSRAVYRHQQAGGNGGT
jgi:hypothetical protein